MRWAPPDTHTDEACACTHPLGRMGGRMRKPLAPLSSPARCAASACLAEGEVCATSDERTRAARAAKVLQISQKFHEIWGDSAETPKRNLGDFKRNSALPKPWVLGKVREMVGDGLTSPLIAEQLTALGQTCSPRQVKRWRRDGRQVQGRRWALPLPTFPGVATRALPLRRVRLHHLPSAEWLMAVGSRQTTDGRRTTTSRAHASWSVDRRATNSGK